MNDLHLKKIIKNSIIHYGISMALAGELYGEKRQSCTMQEKDLCAKGESYHAMIAEKSYNDIMLLIDTILNIPCKDETHGKNVANSSFDNRSIRE